MVLLLLTFAFLLINIAQATQERAIAAANAQEIVITASGNKQETHRQEMRRIKKKRQLQLPGSSQLNILLQNGDIIKLFNTDYYIRSPNPNDRSSNVNSDATQ